MIPKPLGDISWSDILALQDRGREEDDTIEYKASFSGGLDFLAFSDQQKKTALDGIAREVVAFLNARGGDVIIGVKEANSDNPVIEALTPVANVLATVDRLDNALAALIEPKQAIIGVRAIRMTDDESDGIIVVRAPASLRAPHRARDKECYIRRGSKSVPMPMDEVQDVTLNRAARRNEQLESLDRQFVGMADGIFGSRQLSGSRFGVRIVFVPHDNLEIELTPNRLAAMASRNFSTFHFSERLPGNTMAFQNLPNNWRPVLRGRELSGYSQYPNFRDLREEFDFCRKLIRADGVTITDWAYRKFGISSQADGPFIYHDWFKGFLANCLHSLSEISDLTPQHAFGVLRIAITVDGNFEYLVGRDGFETRPSIPTGFTALPDFEVSPTRTLDDIFKRAQEDMLAIVGLEPWEVCSLNAEV